MGESTDVICDRCQEKFSVSEGGGMISELFHCSLCGKEEWVDRSDSESESQQLSKRCECGGTFDIEATSRCPNCKSIKWTVDPNGQSCLYD